MGEGATLATLYADRLRNCCNGMLERPLNGVRAVSPKKEEKIMPPLKIGAAIEIPQLPQFRDWLIEGQRDLELQDFISTVSAGRWEIRDLSQQSDRIF